MSDFETHPVGTGAELERLRKVSADLQGVIHGVGSILDSNLPLNRRFLADQLEAVLRKALNTGEDDEVRIR